MVLLTEACVALTVRMMVPLFWTSYTHFSSHPMLHQPFHQHSTNTTHCSETTDSVSDIVHTGKEAQCGLSAAVCAHDMKMFSVAYVSGFIAKHLLNNSNCDICKKMSDI